MACSTADLWFQEPHVNGFERHVRVNDSSPPQCYHVSLLKFFLLTSRAAFHCLLTAVRGKNLLRLLINWSCSFRVQTSLSRRADFPWYHHHCEPVFTHIYGIDWCNLHGLWRKSYKCCNSKNQNRVSASFQCCFSEVYQLLCRMSSEISASAAATVSLMGFLSCNEILPLLVELYRITTKCRTISTCLFDKDPARISEGGYCDGRGPFSHGPFSLIPRKNYSLALKRLTYDNFLMFCWHLNLLNKLLFHQEITYLNATFSQA